MEAPLYPLLKPVEFACARSNTQHFVESVNYRLRETPKSLVTTHRLRSNEKLVDCSLNARSSASRPNGYVTNITKPGGRLKPVRALLSDARN